jgi:hypothetical protein
MGFSFTAELAYISLYDQEKTVRYSTEDVTRNTGKDKTKGHPRQSQSGCAAWPGPESSWTSRTCTRACLLLVLKQITTARVPSTSGTEETQMASMLFHMIGSDFRKSELSFSSSEPFDVA